MVSDRKSSKEHIGTSEIPIHRSRWSLGVTKQPSISGLRNVINTLVANDYNSFLETFFRGVVRDVVERKVQEHQISRAKVNEGGISGARPLELCFVNNKLPETVFTQSNIISKDGPPLQIAVFDVRSHSIVNNGPFSSMKIEICALKGEFGSSGNEDWTEIEFNANILSGRDGKQPLLVGERIITLKNGVAYISKIILTDNSRWVRGRKFRLGVKAMQNGENVKEGRSQPFNVKDIRGESYKKHSPPFLNDDVWRLTKIAKKGKFHKRLSSHRIHTVKDLLQLLIVNESSLYEKFGQIQKKSWSAIIEHAKLCVVDDYKLYSYLASEQPMMLIFNSIYKLVAVTFDEQNYYLPDTLTPSLKNLVEIVKQDAYKNVDKFLSIDEALLNSISLEACLKSAVQGPKEIRSGYGQPSTSTSYEGMHNCQIYDDPVPIIRETPQKNNVEGEMYIEDGYLTETLINEYLLNTTWGLENNVLLGFSDGAACSTPFNISSNEKPKAVWCKILVAIRWVISLKRDAAARRNANLYFNY